MRQLPLLEAGHGDRVVAVTFAVPDQHLGPDVLEPEALPQMTASWSDPKGRLGRSL